MAGCLHHRLETDCLARRPRSHEHDPDPGPGPGPVEYAPWCRDGSGHTNALPRDDQACISDEHTVELTTEAHVRLARGSIWKRWRCICCGSATRGEPPLRSARGTSRLQPEARRGPRARPHPHGHGPRLTDLVASGGLSPNHDLRHHHPPVPRRRGRTPRSPCGVRARSPFIEQVSRASWATAHFGDASFRWKRDRARIAA